MITSRTQRYICEALGISGFVVLNPQIAYVVRRDLWSGALIAAQDFVWDEVRKFVESLPRVMLYEIRFVGSDDDWVPVAARNDDDLARRIGQLSGLTVAAVRPLSPVRLAAEARKPRAAETDEPPSHQGAARAEHFAKLGIPDPQLPKKSPPKRIYG